MCVLEKDRNQREFARRVNQVVKELCHETDGIVDRFVVIDRAIQLARSGRFEKIGVDDPIANALDLILVEYEDEATEL